MQAVSASQALLGCKIISCTVQTVIKLPPTTHSSAYICTFMQSSAILLISKIIKMTNSSQIAQTSTVNPTLHTDAKDCGCLLSFTLAGRPSRPLICKVAQRTVTKHCKWCTVPRIRTTTKTRMIEHNHCKFVRFFTDFDRLWPQKWMRLFVERELCRRGNFIALCKKTFSTM